MLCYAMLCYAMLCYAMLCYVLCYTKAPGSAETASDAEGPQHAPLTREPPRRRTPSSNSPIKHTAPRRRTESAGSSPTKTPGVGAAGTPETVHAL
jgi:hypothetical protein